MRALTLWSHPLSIFAAAMLLTSCGGSQYQTPALGPWEPATQRTASTSLAARPLLYVAHTLGYGSNGRSVLSILSLRRDKVVARITGYGYITGVCSDASGDVWVPNYRHGHWYVDKFARGGTKAIAELRAPHRWLIFAGCAVDPKSGDLAVMSGGDEDALIWSGARGKPAVYSVRFCPFNAAYDDAGNLFMVGMGCGSDFNFEFGELAKGSGEVAQVELDKRTGPPGGVQWDGATVVIATAAYRASRRHPVLYRVQVSGTAGKVVGVVRVPGFFDSFSQSPNFALNDGTVIGAAVGRSREHVRTWPYPAGGKPTQSIARYEAITGIALSR